MDYVDEILREEERKQSIAERNRPKCDDCHDHITGDVYEYGGFTYCEDCAMNIWNDLQDKLNIVASQLQAERAQKKLAEYLIEHMIEHLDVHDALNDIKETQYE